MVGLGIAEAARAAARRVREVGSVERCQIVTVDGEPYTIVFDTVPPGDGRLWDERARTIREGLAFLGAEWLAEAVCPEVPSDNGYTLAFVLKGHPDFLDVLLGVFCDTPSPALGGGDGSPRFEPLATSVGHPPCYRQAPEAPATSVRSAAPALCLPDRPCLCRPAQPYRWRMLPTAAGFPGRAVVWHTEFCGSGRLRFRSR